MLMVAGAAQVCNRGGQSVPMPGLLACSPDANGVVHARLDAGPSAHTALLEEEEGNGSLTS